MKILITIDCDHINFGDFEWSQREEAAKIIHETANIITKDGFVTRNLTDSYGNLVVGWLDVIHG